MEADVVGDPAEGGRKGARTLFLLFTDDAGLWGRAVMRELTALEMED